MPALSKDFDSNLTPIHTKGFDEFELGLLVLLRHFSKCYKEPEQHGWQNAFVIASERWGELIGLRVAYSLMRVIQSIRRCRPAGVHVLDPLCIETREYLTPDEAAFIGMIHHMRRDETPQAREQVQVLGYGRNDPAIIHAGLSFANRFSLGKRKIGSSSIRHMLYVVA